MREARFVRDEGVAGSNPATPTTLPRNQKPLPDSFPDRNAGVYIIKGRGWLKIGRTRDVAGRLSSLQSASAIPLTLEHFEPCGELAPEVERQAHLLLAQWRMKGEWFNTTVGMAELAIEAACDQCSEKLEFFRLQSLRPRARTQGRKDAVEFAIMERFPGL